MPKEVRSAKKLSANKRNAFKAGLVRRGRRGLEKKATIKGKPRV